MQAVGPTWGKLREVCSAWALTTTLLFSPMPVDFTLPAAGCNADMIAAPSSLIDTADGKRDKLHTRDSGH